MAKLKPVVLKWHSPNTDGTFNVKIKIAHKSKSAHLDTGQTISKRNLFRGQIKPLWIAENMADILNNLNASIKQIASNIDEKSVQDIKEYLLSRSKKLQVEKIDFLKYFENYCQTLKK